MNNKPVIHVDRLYLIEGNGPTKAFADLLILDTFMIKGLRIVQGKDALFVSMPREQGKDGEWYDTFFAKTPEMTKGLQELVLEAYEERKAKVT